MSVADMMNVANIVATVQKVAKDPRPYVVASAPICLVIGTPLTIAGACMLVCFGCTAFGLLCTMALSSFFFVAAFILLFLGLLPLAVAMWAFKPKEFKQYSNQGITVCVKSLQSCGRFVDPGEEEPKIALYKKVHSVRRLMCKGVNMSETALTWLDDKIQRTEI